MIVGKSVWFIQRCDADGNRVNLEDYFEGSV